MIIGKRVKFGKKLEQEGTLVSFGISFEELRDGIGHYTAAIIMTDDGALSEVPATWTQVIMEEKQ